MKKDTELDQETIKTVEIKLIEATVEKRNKIIAMAKEKAKLIIQTAEQECEQIRNKFNEQVSNKVDKEIQTLREKIVREAEFEGRKILMRAREEAISIVFKKVEDRLQEIVKRKEKTFNFDEILIKLIIEAVKEIDEKNIFVSTNKHEINYLKKNQNEIVNQIQQVLGKEVNLQVLDNPIATIGGVIVQNRDTTKIYYNTLEARLKTLRDTSEVVVAKILEVL